MSYEVNETDLYAIKKALHQRSIHQGRVVAVTVGAVRAKEALHVAYAKGVDHAIHMVDEVSRGGDSNLNVAAAAEVVKTRGYDAIFAGINRMYGGDPTSRRHADRCCHEDVEAHCRGD